jgi:hypothetical protein
MYLIQPNYFLNYGLNNNQRFYTEKFKNNNISGIFNYHKLIYNSDKKENNIYTILVNIGIDDNDNNIKYRERYEFKNFEDTYTQLHELGKLYKTNNFICNYKPLEFNDIPNHIKNFIYMKNDKDIL